jgi:hypothetical protein
MYPTNGWDINKESIMVNKKNTDTVVKALQDLFGSRTPGEDCIHPADVLERVNETTPMTKDELHEFLDLMEPHIIKSIKPLNQETEALNDRLIKWVNMDY